MLGTWLRPFLAQLVRLTGETANLAMLDGDEVVYIAQVPSPHSMRMFTEPGRRVRPHCTAVGKALLAQLPPGEARALLERDGMPAYTPATITDPDLLIAHLEVIRKQGYAVDEGEQEVGVRCFAVAVPDAPGSLAISTSGPQTRMTDDAAARIVPALKRTARGISQTIAAEGRGLSGSSSPAPPGRRALRSELPSPAAARVADVHLIPAAAGSVVGDVHRNRALARTATSTADSVPWRRHDQSLRTPGSG